MSDVIIDIDQIDPDRKCMWDEGCDLMAVAGIGHDPVEWLCIKHFETTMEIIGAALQSARDIMGQS